MNGCPSTYGEPLSSYELANDTGGTRAVLPISYDVCMSVWGDRKTNNTSGKERWKNRKVADVLLAGGLWWLILIQANVTVTGHDSCQSINSLRKGDELIWLCTGETFREAVSVTRHSKCTPYKESLSKYSSFPAGVFDAAPCISLQCFESSPYRKSRSFDQLNIVCAPLGNLVSV